MIGLWWTGGSGGKWPFERDMFLGPWESAAFADQGSKGPFTPLSLPPPSHAKSNLSKYWKGGRVWSGLFFSLPLLLSQKGKERKYCFLWQESKKRRNQSGGFLKSSIKERQEIELEGFHRIQCLPSLSSHIRCTTACFSSSKTICLRSETHDINNDPLHIYVSLHSNRGTVCGDAMAPILFVCGLTLPCFALSIETKTLLPYRHIL